MTDMEKRMKAYADHAKHLHKKRSKKRLGTGGGCLR